MRPMNRTRAEAFPALLPVDEPSFARLFDFRFLSAMETFDELVDSASWRILETLGALPGPHGLDPEELAGARAMPERIRVPLRYLFEKLASSGLLAKEGARYFPGSANAGRFEDLAAELQSLAPESVVGVEVVSVLVGEAPAFFAGEKCGEDVLFSPIRLPLWFRFFSNDNPLYAINNLVGAEAIARAAPPEHVKVLEIGGGAGSAAEAALKRLGARISCYRFTEVVPTFLRRGERIVRAAAPASTRVTSARLDMTKPWGEQGIEPESADVVYAVNCFHVAPDLDAVLAEATRAVAPGGVVVVSECMRPTGSTLPIYVEFVFNFLESFTNVKTHPERRPTHGFLTPRAWRASLEAAGLEVEIVPDVDALARRYPRFFVGAAIARRPG
jgi:SAM-dependent methyltransferase